MERGEMKKQIEAEFVPVRPPFKASVERERLVERMLTVEIEQILDYGEITKIIGEKAQGPRGLGIIRRAKRAVRNAHHRVFVNIPNEGLKRLNDDEIIDHVSSTVIIAVRRKVRVGAKELECVSYAELPLEKRAGYHLNRTLVHYIGTMVNNESLKSSRALIASQSDVVEAGNVLSLFQLVPQPETKAG
jgi:hypothetical protein